MELHLDNAGQPYTPPAWAEAGIDTAELTITELLAIQQTARLTGTQFRAIKAELKSREV